MLQGADRALEGLQTPQWDSSEPVKSKWTFHVPSDTDYRVYYATVLQLQLCELAQRPALNSQAHIRHTVHESKNLYNQFILYIHSLLLFVVANT